MAGVPKSYPAEPGETRCGGSYQDIVIVNGEIPGTDFGSQFIDSIQPIWFRDGMTKKVPLFTSRNDVRKELRRPDGVQDRLKYLERRVVIQSHFLNPQEVTALQWLLEQSWNLLDRAVLESNGGKPAQKKVKEALQHMRCAEYWIMRTKLVNDAMQEYQPELALTGVPPGLVFDAPKESELPPIDEPTKEKKKAPAKKDNTLLYLGGLGLAIAGYVWYKKKK